eukprot:gnl/TRDRNA2_/TRDRNA2_164621_c4_seq3.p1 gnl/TRDRNA2_/TRDRNA2_164621_c4~~gnl/TRDRNA2_/TRDRNA2_164621_c4_seq3.p1  ORF type:complete len:504 (+),score=97.65 gnl/TRDRNA2_/TRDRNA2_164621_c4_seq3:311-1822(+)
MELAPEPPISLLAACRAPKRPARWEAQKPQAGPKALVRPATGQVAGIPSGAVPTSPTNQLEVSLIEGVGNGPAASPTAEELGTLLCNAQVARQLESAERATSKHMTVLVQLANQAIRMGIDYRTLKLGWEHPTTRTQYRKANHPSATCKPSRQRAEESRARLVEALEAVAEGKREVESVITEFFVSEIGVVADSRAAEMATYAGVEAALEAELLLPLRALNEGQESMHQTYNGEPVPPAEVAKCVESIISSVLSQPGGFAAWRYSNPVGIEQLRGLTLEQISLWREATSMEHARGLRTHEDATGELGFFWATKIGGPSHGFDYEAQCLLPLLANARHKVVLVSDPDWPAHPTGRAHWRLLWAAGSDGSVLPDPEPRLWFEHVNCDFDAQGKIDMASWVTASLKHVVAKADAMCIPLSIDLRISGHLLQAAEQRDSGGAVWQTAERYILRPSNGVCEASDFLSDRHDWVQTTEEVSEPLWRALYVPENYSSPSSRPEDIGELMS